MFGEYVLNRCVQGDSIELAKSIPDNSIDIIFTDPPYDRDSVPLYGWLASEAARVLKPGGFCCAMSGGYHLADVFAQMNGEGLDWYFKVELFGNGVGVNIYPRRIVTKTKPILMWTKGQSAIEVWNMVDVYNGQGRDKRYHQWGQDVGSARYVIEYILGDKNMSTALLWEPFAGGGATLQACKYLGVDFISSEIDAQAVKTCNDRLDGVIQRIVPNQMTIPLLTC